jgi:NADH-quinone oxidoreductase subunit M
VALKFLMFQIAGGLVLLGGVIGLYVLSARAGSPSFLVSDLAHVPMSTADQRWLFAAFFVACAIKAPLFPVHTWLADTTGAATPPTSILLVCLLDKIGTFAMIRYCLGLFPDASRWATPVVIAVALVSILYGAVRAIGEDDVLRLVGLTSLSHFGLITLGVFVGTQQGLTGAVSYMFNHGIATGALFLVAGAVIRRTGTSSIREMAGMEGTAPVLAAAFLVAGLATAGLPGLSPFPSELLVIVGAFDHHWYVGAIAVAVTVLAAVYVLRAYQLVFTGPSRGRRTLADLGGVERLIIGPLVGAMLLFGLWPGPILDQAGAVVASSTAGGISDVR